MSYFVVFCVECEECEATEKGLYSKLYILGPRFVLSAAVFVVGGSVCESAPAICNRAFVRTFKFFCFWGQAVHRAVIDR